MYFLDSVIANRSLGELCMRGAEECTEESLVLGSVKNCHFCSPYVVVEIYGSTQFCIMCALSAGNCIVY
jgi:hypothetical protein